MRDALRWVGQNHDRAIFAARLLTGWMVRLTEDEGADVLGFGDDADEAADDAMRKVNDGKRRSRNSRREN